MKSHIDLKDDLEHAAWKRENPTWKPRNDHWEPAEHYLAIVEPLGWPKIETGYAALALAIFEENVKQLWK